MRSILLEAGVFVNLTGRPIEVSGHTLEPSMKVERPEQVPQPAWELVRDGRPEGMYAYLSATPGFWAKNHLGWEHAPVCYIVPDELGSEQRFDVWTLRQFVDYLNSR
jgi:hypothetical protein